MAVTPKAGTGAKSQFWLHDGTSLVRLLGAKSIKFPTATRGEQEITDLESDAAEFAPDLPDFGSFPVVFNHLEGSQTDTILAAAAADPNSRSFKIVVAVRGVLTSDYTGTAFLSEYELPELAQGTVQESTATFRMSGTMTKTAHT